MEGRKKKKLTIEDYLDFVDDRTLPLTVSELLQIVGMHGFIKTASQKNILREMVASMELMDLRRSTLLDGWSGGARLTLKQVNDDLKFINWQDCHVTSLLTYGASSSSTAANHPVLPKRKRSKMSETKEVKIKAGAVNSVISTSGTTVVAGSTTTTDLNSAAA